MRILSGATHWARCAFSMLVCTATMGLGSGEAVAHSVDEAPAPATGGKAAGRPSLMAAFEGDVLGEVGSWVEYGVLDKGKLDVTIRQRMLVSGGRGPEERWFEMWLDPSGGTAMRGRIDSRSEVPSDDFQLKMMGAYYTFGTVSDGAMCLGGSCSAGSSAPAGGVLTEEIIETRAGKFRTRHSIRQTPAGEMHIWHSTDVPVIQLVRLVMPDKRGFELVEMGRGGKSAFPANVRTIPFPFDNVGAAIGAFFPQLISPARVPAAASTKTGRPGEDATPAPGNQKAGECQAGTANCSSK